MTGTPAKRSMLTVSIRHDEMATVTREAARRGKPRAVFVREAIEAYIGSPLSPPSTRDTSPRRRKPAA